MVIIESDLAMVRARHRNEKVVLTGGGFDILHCGHLDFLEAAKQLGDVLVVALANDDELRARKGYGQPVINESNRARMVSALRTVDYAVVREGAELADSMIAVAAALQPDVLVLYADIPSQIFKRISKALPCAVIINDQKKTDSTTDIIRRSQKERHETTA